MNRIQYLRGLRVSPSSSLFNLLPRVLGLVKDLAQDKRNGHPTLVRLLLQPLEMLLGNAEGMPAFARLLHSPSFLNHHQEYNGIAKYFQSYSLIILDIA